MAAVLDHLDTLNKPVAENISFSLPSEDSEYWLNSKFDVLAIIRDIVKKEAHLTLHSPKHGIQSSQIIGIQEDKHLVLAGLGHIHGGIVESSPLFIHTRLDGVEVVAMIKPSRKGTFGGSEAIFAEIPDRLHRQQRREDHRVKVPSYRKNDCTVKLNGPAHVLKKSDAKLIDISLGGVRLEVPEALGRIQNLANILQSAVLPIDGEQISVDLKLRHIQEKKAPNGQVTYEIGCSFVQLSPYDRREIAKMVRQIEFENHKFKKLQ